MLVDILSDTHCDSRVHTHDDLFKLHYVKDPEVDVCLFAGDAGNGRAWYEGTIAWLQTMYKQVIGVPGNHDYWLGKGQVPLPQMPLEDSMKVYAMGDLLVATATLWTNFRGNPVAQEACRAMLRDFERIGINPQDMVDMHYISRDHLASSKADVWVVHFPPFLQSLHKMYDTPQDIYHNMYFVNVMEKGFAGLDAGERPPLIVHGHTHTPFDYYIDKTRVVCNPIGYVFERSPALSIQPVTIEI